MRSERFAGYFVGKYEILDSGMDSVVVRDGTCVRHYYPFLGPDQLGDYQALMRMARDTFSARPFVRKPDRSYTVVLQDVVDMRDPEYDSGAACWTTAADYVPGPHLSELFYASRQHREGLFQLDMEERMRLTNFRDLLESQGLVPEITGMLREAGQLLRSRFGMDGIEITTLDTKARSFMPGKINLVVTDICPSIDRMAIRR